MADKSIPSSRRRNKDGLLHSVSLTSFVSIDNVKAGGRRAEHDICDSAFLAERGIFTRPKSIKHPQTGAAA